MVERAEKIMKLLQVIGIFVCLSGTISVILKYYIQANANKWSDGCCGYVNHLDPSCDNNQYETYGFTKDINNICIVNNSTCNTFPMLDANNGEYWDGYYFISKGGNFSYCTVNKTSIYNKSDTEIDAFNVDEVKLLNTTCTQQNLNESINWANDQFLNFLLWFFAAFPGFLFSFYLSICEVFCEKLYKQQKGALCILCCPCVLCCSCMCEGECKGSGLIVNIGYYFTKFILYAFASAGNDQFNSGVNDSLYFAISDWSEESNDIFANCYAGYNPIVYDNTQINQYFTTIDNVCKICVYIGYALTVIQFLLNTYIDHLKGDDNDNEKFLIND